MASVEMDSGDPFKLIFPFNNTLSGGELEREDSLESFPEMAESRPVPRRAVLLGIPELLLRAPV